MKKTIIAIAIVCLSIFLIYKTDVKDIFCNYFQSICGSSSKKHTIAPIGQNNNDDWVKHFSNNAGNVLRTSYADVTTSFIIDLSQPILDTIINNSPKTVKFIFIRNNNKIGLVIQGVNSKYYLLDSQSGSLSEINTSTFNSLKTNYDSIKPMLDVPNTNSGQTDHICFPSFEGDVALALIDKTKPAQFNLGQITTTTPTNPIIDYLVATSPNNLTVILQATGKLGNTLYFDASHTTPPGNCP